MTASAITERTTWRQDAIAVPRDASIDTMRGVAILMVIGIHSLQQPLGAPWGIVVDAVLRPCVPIFLFASGFLTARSGRVALAKRFRTALIPYTIAFIAAYVYMASHNPAMDHRIATTAARYVLAYVFVYYYVFVYLGCTVML
jgi:surface polysaccharide O-acyltransferase-like enzyme